MRLAEYAERLFWTSALLCLGYCVVAGIQARGTQRLAQEISERALGAKGSPNAGSPINLPTTGEVIGRIEIPALDLSAPITADYDGGSLRKGVGHIPGTAVPGGLGTVGLAGHRDSFFRPLRWIAPQMEIRLTDRTGMFHYIVDSTEIVNPDKVEVLNIAARPELTLITCFPFDYVGAAPKRFIVHAHLLSASPDEVAANH